MPGGPSRLIAIVLIWSLALPWPARAHNESVHQSMTDYVYHVLLAGAHFSQRGPMSERLRITLQRLETANPGLKAFFADAAAAKPKLRALLSGLPLDNSPRDVAREAFLQEYFRASWRVRVVNGANQTSPWSPFITQGPATGGVAG